MTVKKWRQRQIHVPIESEAFLELHPELVKTIVGTPVIPGYPGFPGSPLPTAYPSYTGYYGYGNYGYPNYPGYPGHPKKGCVPRPQKASYVVRCVPRPCAPL